MDLNSIAQRGATLFLNMIFRDGFYHADLHPGNLMVLDRQAVVKAKEGEIPTRIIGVLDCGTIGRVDIRFVIFGNPKELISCFF